MTSGRPPLGDDATVLGRRPLHARPGLVALVALGGAAGTAVRATVAALLPAAGGWPWATVTVNLTGAFALGLLLEALTRTGPDDGRRRAARLLAGTGFLGGYTTYSTLALDTVLLAEDGGGLRALAYAVGSVLAGLVAAGAGIAVGARVAHHPAGVAVPPHPRDAGGAS